MADALPPRTIDDVLDYTIDWSDWLQQGEAIAEKVVSCVRGDTEVSQITSDEISVTFWLSAGTRAIAVHRIAVKITTDAVPPRTREQIFPITILPAAS